MIEYEYYTKINYTKKCVKNKNIIMCKNYLSIIIIKCYCFIMVLLIPLKRKTQVV